MWSSLSLDYDSKISKEKSLEISLKDLRSGSIIVFHDSLKAQTKVVYVLEKLLLRLDRIGLSTSVIDLP
jgi:hypothetical protein